MGRPPRARKRRDAPSLLPSLDFQPAKLKQGGRSLTKRKQTGEMNGYERDRAAELAAMMGRGEIAFYAFEHLKLRLADDTYYTPDFMVVYLDGRTVIEDVKGSFQEDAARVKMKVAATMFPWEFHVLSRKRKTDPWTVEHLRGWMDDPTPATVMSKGPKDQSAASVEYAIPLPSIPARAVVEVVGTHADGSALSVVGDRAVDDDDKEPKF